MTTINEDPTTDTARRNRVLLASAVLVTLIVALAVFVAWPNNNDPKASPSTSTTAKASSSDRPGSDAGSSPDGGDGCSGIPASSKIPEEAPSAHWNLFHGVALPSGPGIGPTAIDGEVAKCFAHTPVGAVTAAYHIVIRYYLGGEGERVVREQTVPNEGQRFLLTAFASSVGEVRTSECQLAGYRIVSYMPDEAALQVMTTCKGSSQVSSSETHMEWSGTDWLVRLESDGTPGPATKVQDSSSFTPWAGAA